MATTVKRKLPSTKVEEKNDDIDLFVDAPPDEEDTSDDGDTTDSEESEYSGLEDEPDTSSEDEEEEEDEESSMSESSSDDPDDTIEIQDNKNKSTTRNSKAKKTTESKQLDNAPSASTSVDNLNLLNTPKADEFEFDSSDEEDIRNTVGNIPMEWYKEYEHIGYDLLGKKILKPKSGDELDEFLQKMDNPNYWRTVKDKSTGQNVVLSDKDIDTIEKLRKGKYVDPNHDEYKPWIDFFTHETMIHPVTNRPEHKRSFIPSKWEKIKVGKIVHAMKMGWIKPKSEKTEEEDEHKFYELWKNDDQSEINKRLHHHIPAPKLPLPGHEESYNPPPEYLFTEEEELAWKEQDPEDRRMNFVPQKYSSLRHVPAFSRFINERFERCLDLYLCPRQRKMRMNVNPEDLIPKLPKPQELQPFPTVQAILFEGHTSLVRSISVEPTGQWMLSGSDDETVKVWEISTGRCMKTIKMGGVVKSVAWNPNPSFCLAAAVVGEDVIIFNPMLGDKLVMTNTDNMISSFESQEDTAPNKVPVEWNQCKDKEYEEGLRLRVSHPKAVGQVCWHGKGDYFAVVLPQGESLSVIIHQLSKRRSQNPFKKSKGMVQCVLFHPTRPFLFVATQRYVRVYNLLKQELAKKLMTNCKWVSSMAVHPGGDNVIIGSYDCRLSWFDLDLSTKPYQTLRHHKKAIRSVCYHKRYPLFASASDDGTVIVCHGRVYSDLLQNPLIVPVKILRGHVPTNNLGTLGCEFHPTQPWIFSCGSDSTIRLYT